MIEEKINIATSNEYTHIGNLSVQLLGTRPKSMNGLSPLALIKVISPNNEAEEVLLDLVEKQYYVSHGQTFKLTDIDVGTAYLPWTKMFTGAISITAMSEEREPVLVVGQEAPVAAGNVQATSVRPCNCDTDNNISAVIKNGQYSPQTASVPQIPFSPITSLGGCGDKTQNMHCPFGGGGRTDTSILAIVLGLISLGLLGLAFALIKKRD